MPSAFTCVCPERHTKLGLARQPGAGARLKCPECGGAFAPAAEPAPARLSLHALAITGRDQKPPVAAVNVTEV